MRSQARSFPKACQTVLASRVRDLSVRLPILSLHAMNITSVVHTVHRKVGVASDPSYDLLYNVEPGQVTPKDL